MPRTSEVTRNKAISRIEKLIAFHGNNPDKIYLSLREQKEQGGCPWGYDVARKYIVKQIGKLLGAEYIKPGGVRNCKSKDKLAITLAEHGIFHGDPYLAHKKGMGYAVSFYENTWREAKLKLTPRDKRLPAQMKKKYALSAAP